jgi:hypothetical protein
MAYRVILKHLEVVRLQWTIRDSQVEALKRMLRTISNNEAMFQFRLQHCKFLQGKWTPVTNS